MDEKTFRRFAAKVALPDENGCMHWTAAKGYNGYGRIEVAGRKVLPHRLSYEHFVSPIPDGPVIDHLCRNRSCVSPEHLEAKSSRANLLAPGSEALTADHAARTHCPRGHELAGANLKPSGIARGRRECLSCARACAARGAARRRDIEWSDDQFREDADRRYAELMEPTAAAVAA